MSSCIQDDFFEEHPNQQHQDGNHDQDSNTDPNLDPNQDGNQEGGNNGNPVKPEYQESISYVWDLTALPEIQIEVPLTEWNNLLASYDRNNSTREYIHCNATYIKGDDVHKIQDVGLRLRGNTSRRRPEAGSGPHVQGSADWQHCHYGLHFRKFVKDQAHTVHGIHKVNLKWFKDDPIYAREVFCYDLFRRFGVWTAINSSYCRLKIHVEGDPEPTNMGVYEMIEPVNDEYLKYRADKFGAASGNLWKCSWGANLNDVADHLFGEDNNINNYTYEWKCGLLGYAPAKEQLKDFILKLTGKGEDSFYKWIQEVCDVELLLKTYAVNVAVGMWDDYWNNSNNYYLYFSTTDKYKYKVFFIPFDYDNTLGTSANCGNIQDSGRQNPWHWGSSSNPLIERLLRFPEFRQIYENALRDLVNPANEMMDFASAYKRISTWHKLINPYVSNDTGEDMLIEDKTASWSNHKEYRLMDSGGNNFFIIKAQSIDKM